MIRIRTLLTTRRHALAVLATIVALGLAVALAHSTFGADHMSGMAGMDDPQGGHSALVTMCLAIVEVGVAGVAFLVLLRVVRRRRIRSPRRTRFLIPARQWQARPGPRARAGPALIQVYRL